MSESYQEQREQEQREFEKKRQDLHQRELALAASRGELRGQALGAYSELQADPDIAEDLRALAWFRADPKIRNGVSLDQTGRVQGLPKGWPPDHSLETALGARRDATLAVIDSGEPIADDVLEVGDSPSVQKLRGLLGQGGER